MAKKFRYIKLLKNTIYPSYQLYAYMADKKTSPQDGLRLGALITLHWLKSRLGDDSPLELSDLPDIDSFASVKDESLVSFHVSCGFVIDVVSMLEKGIWTLQITEPDLGSDPGNPQQERQAIPGRIIETNVGFCIHGTELECGFKTVISDPEGTAQKAEVYRLAIIRQLINHPNFGLRQCSVLSEKPTLIDKVEQLKNLFALVKEPSNQLPCIVFTYRRPEKVTPSFPQMPLTAFQPKTDLFAKLPTQALSHPSLDYDTTNFANRITSFGRSYILEDNLFERFKAMSCVQVEPGDVVVMDPARFGGNTSRLSYKQNSGARSDALDALYSQIREYSRDKEISFGHIRFLSAARDGLLKETEDSLRIANAVSQEWKHKMDLMELQFSEQLNLKEKEIETVTKQLERQKEYTERVNQEKEILRANVLQELDRKDAQIAEKEEQIAFLYRKLSQPNSHSEIAAWVEANFADRLVLHQKAKNLLVDRDARRVDVHLICDAIDYLATDYWDNRYERLAKDEMLTRCSRKYNRPFEIKPTGDQTIECYPAQYKIKYFPHVRGTAKESPLDYHLRVGNANEDLLRIYFLHDDVKKLIVVGSLPIHLDTIIFR